VDESNVFNKVPYRFCLTKYDVSKEGRNKLERSLIDAAKDSSGLELIVASGIGAADKTGARRAFVLQCDCSLYYKSIIVNPSNAPHKRSSLRNDGVNKRSAKQGGRNANHRRDTKRVLDRKGEGSASFAFQCMSIVMDTLSREGSDVTCTPDTLNRVGRLQH
jgi:hypothetical protein